MANLNIAKFLMNSNIEGPGTRFVVWFQGCMINCKGCSNQEMIPLVRKMFMPNEYLYEKIQEAKEKYNIEGITIIGGEPFLQPDGLRDLVNWCWENKLSIICFTGYIYEKLNEEYGDILSKIDILIDGPFIISQLDRTRRLIGSKNQRVLKLTDRYKDCTYFDEPHLEVEIQLYNNRVHINGDGTIFDNSEGKFSFEIK